MDAFDVVAEPVRRRVLELLADAEMTAGAVTEAVRADHSISQPAVSQHLKVLREAGFVKVRTDGSRRLYAVDVGAFADIDEWLDRFRVVWEPRMDALATEVARGQRARRREAPDEPDTDRSAS